MHASPHRFFDCFANAIFIKPLRRARLKHVKRIERN